MAVARRLPWHRGEFGGKAAHVSGSIVLIPTAFAYRGSKRRWAAIHRPSCLQIFCAERLDVAKKFVGMLRERFDMTALGRYAEGERDPATDETIEEIKRLIRTTEGVSR